jgi:hypothetical protein
MAPEIKNSLFSRLKPRISAFVAASGAAPQ